MTESRVRMMLEMKKATMECNPLRMNGRRCTALYPEELDELMKTVDSYERIISRLSEEIKDAKS